MLTPIINLVVALTLALYSTFGGLFATYMPMIGAVTVVPGGATVTVEPVNPAQTDLPTEPEVTPDPAAEGAYTTLQRGQSGEAVLALQQRLTDLGYYTGKLTGKMDSATQLAFKKFEKANGFNANGVASPEEQIVLFSADAVAAE